MVEIGEAMKQPRLSPYVMARICLWTEQTLWKGARWERASSIPYSHTKGEGSPEALGSGLHHRLKKFIGEEEAELGTGPLFRYQWGRPHHSTHQTDII